MPIFDLQCPQCAYEDHDRFFHVRPASFGHCPDCDAELVAKLFLGVPLTHTFGEDREFIDHHIRPDGKPQVITSWGQRKRLMREFNLEDAGPAKKR
jgi:hypothetical protein